MMAKCSICGGTVQRKTISFSVGGILVGRFPSSHCKNCGDEWFDEATAKKIEALTKERGLFGMETKTSVSYAGNSLMIRIPKKLAAALGIKKGDPVLLKPEAKNKILIEIASG